MQRLLATADWDPDLIRDDLRGYVVEHLGDAATEVPRDAGHPRDGSGPPAVLTRQGSPPPARRARSGE